MHFEALKTLLKALLPHYDDNYHHPVAKQTLSMIDLSHFRKPI